MRCPYTVCQSLSCCNQANASSAFLTRRRCFPNFKQGLTCGGTRVQGEMGAHVHPDMKDAALHEGIWPLFLQGCSYAASAVADHYQWGRDFAEERFPCGL